MVHIDELGTSDPLPFGINGPPFVVIRVQPIAGALARYKVTSSDPSDESEEDIVQTGRVSDRVIHTSKYYRLRTSLVSMTVLQFTSTAYSNSAREKTLFPRRQLLVVLVLQYSDWTPFRATFSMLSPEQFAATSSVDPSVAHDDPSQRLHARPYPHKVVQTGALRASHTAPVQRLPQLLASLVWTTRLSMVPVCQDKSRKRVHFSVGVDPQGDQEASQMSLPSAGRRDQDLYRVRSRESKALQSMRSMMPLRLFQRNV